MQRTARRFLFITKGFYEDYTLDGQQNKALSLRP